MRFSYKWLQEWVPIEKLGSFDALSGALACKGLEIDVVEPVGKGLEKVFVGLLKAKEKHPQADRLQVCEVFDGTENRIIVCGARNMEVGDKVAVALPGALLPGGVSIKASSIRGQASSGMLCSESELGRQSETDGIWILPNESVPGRCIREMLGLDDTLLEIKIPANRPDLLGHYGLARELSQLFGLPLKPMPTTLHLPSKGDLTLTVKTPLCSSFSLTKVRLLKVKESPWVKLLAHFGFKSRGPFVDATNLALLEMGHPTHAYDAARVGSTFVADTTTEPLELDLIGAEKRAIPEGSIVVLSKGEIVALAGITGTESSSISATTEEAIIEVACFDKEKIRETVKSCALKTESSDRFSRGVDAWDATPLRVLHWLQELADVEMLEHVSWARQYVPARIHFQPTWARQRLGIPEKDATFGDGRVRDVITRLGCTFKKNAWEPPSYRSDLQIPEDLCEELIRVKGLELIPSVLPHASGPLVPNEHEKRATFFDQLKNFLTQEGFDECKHYPYVSHGALESLGFHSDLPLLNPLSEDMKWLVPSLIPGWIQTLTRTQNHHFGLSPWAFRGFELRPVFFKDDTKETGVREPMHLAIALTGPRDRSGFRHASKASTFQDIQSLLLKLADFLCLPQTRFEPLSSQKPVWQPGQEARWMHANGDVLGTCGKLHPRLGLKQAAFMIEIDADRLYAQSVASQKQTKWTSWPIFPGIERDLTVEVPIQVGALAILKEAKKLLKGANITLLDVFPKEGHQNVSLRARFQKPDRSLTTDEVEPILERARISLNEKKW